MIFPNLLRKEETTQEIAAISNKSLRCGGIGKVFTYNEAARLFDRYGLQDAGKQWEIISPIKRMFYLYWMGLSNCDLCVIDFVRHRLMSDMRKMFRYCKRVAF